MTTTAAGNTPAPLGIGTRAVHTGQEHADTATNARTEIYGVDAFYKWKPAKSEGGWLKVLISFLLESSKKQSQPRS